MVHELAHNCVGRGHGGPDFDDRPGADEIEKDFEKNCGADTVAR